MARPNKSAQLKTNMLSYVEVAKKLIRKKCKGKDESFYYPLVVDDFVDENGEKIFSYIARRLIHILRIEPDVEYVLVPSKGHYKRKGFRICKPFEKMNAFFMTGYDQFDLFNEKEGNFFRSIIRKAYAKQLDQLKDLETSILNNSGQAINNNAEFINNYLYYLYELDKIKPDNLKEDYDKLLSALLSEFYTLGLFVEKCKVKGMDETPMAIPTTEFANTLNVSAFEVNEIIEKLVKLHILSKSEKSNVYQITLTAEQAAAEIAGIDADPDKAYDVDIDNLDHSFEKLIEAQDMYSNLKAIQDSRDTIDKALRELYKAQCNLAKRDKVYAEDARLYADREKEINDRNAQLETAAIENRELKRIAAENENLRKENYKRCKDAVEVMSVNINSTVALFQRDILTYISKYIKNSDQRDTVKALLGKMQIEISRDVKACQDIVDNK